MANEWFFKWHQIGRDQSAEIDSFDGRMIHYGGVKFDGTPRQVYWQTIERYLRQKVGDIFDRLEQQLKDYPVHVRRKALKETRDLVVRFAINIRKAAVVKDRILRGDGMNFPTEQDLGRWVGSRPFEIESKIKSLTQIYCEVPSLGVDFQMPIDDMMTDKLTFVKKDGTELRKDVPGLVTPQQVTTFVTDIQVEVDDHILRPLPNGLVEDYIVVDPMFYDVGGFDSHFQIKVRRSSHPQASAQTVINNITQNFHGDHARGYVNSTDNSTNTTVVSWVDVASFLEQAKQAIPHLPEPQRAAMVEPVTLLEDEIKSGKPDQSKMRAALQSMKAIAEGAAGNIFATGIVGAISHLILAANS